MHSGEKPIKGGGTGLAKQWGRQEGEAITSLVVSPEKSQLVSWSLNSSLYFNNKSLTKYFYKILVVFSPFEKDSPLFVKK